MAAPGRTRPATGRRAPLLALLLAASLLAAAVSRAALPSAAPCQAPPAAAPADGGLNLVELRIALGLLRALGAAGP
jgi:hypothetical protein